MPVETPSLFAQVIKDHLELKERNSGLDRHMPIDRYRVADPFENHPLFKTEEQARQEETMDGQEPSVVSVTVPLARRGDRGERGARRDRGLGLLGRRSRPRLRLGRLRTSAALRAASVESLCFAERASAEPAPSW